MVARLPQQVLLLLVLVTGTTTGTVYRPELSDWTTASSTRRVGASATRLSHPTSFKGHDSPTRSSGHGKRPLDSIDGFSDSSVDVGITVSTDLTTSRNFRLGSVLTDSDDKSLSYKRKKVETRYQNVDWNQELKEESTGSVHLKKLKKLGVSDERGSASFFTNPSINENQSQSTLSSKRSGTLQGNKETLPFSSGSIIGNPVENSILLSNQKTSGSISLSSSTSSLSPLATSLLNGQSMTMSSGHSRSMETRLLAAFRNSETTTVTPNSNSINVLDTRNLRLDQKFPDFGGELLHERTKIFGDISSAMSAEGSAGVLVPSSIKKLLQTEDGNAEIPVDTPLVLQEMANPLAKSDDQAVSFPIYSSPVGIIRRSVPGKFHVLEISGKQPSKKVSLNVRPTEESRFILTTEEQVELSSSHFDVPPPHFLTTPMVDGLLQDNIGKIPLNRDKYRRGQFDWLTSEQVSLPVTTSLTTAVGFPKRYIRDADMEKCEKFLLNDDVKREFYSPNYPQNYPPKTNCVRTLEAEKGMLLKLDFRERFELEAMTPIGDKPRECRFDYLEVRDGQYGFSDLLGVFCDKNFPPEIISKSRHLWLHFHSDDTIEYQGFKAVWSTVPRPTESGMPPEQEPCIRNITNQSEAIVGIDDVQAEKKIAIKHKIALDCLWVITAPADSRMQMTFDTFKLDKPNDCSANFLDVFDQRTDIPSRLKNFCGSIAEPVHTVKNTMYIRFYLEPKAINGTFKSLITVVRDKGSTDKPCRDNEYDCDDATCIALSLKCNSRYNCRFLRDEDAAMCGTTTDQFDSSRVIIILVIFSLIMCGMCFAFVFNCVRKLMRDHKIIREHIRQSRENRLDEIGRKATPCPVSLSRTDLREHRSESPSVEIDSNKELIPATMISCGYTKELPIDLKYGTKEMNDIHQSNNVSNATQERLQESSEELEMCDSSCQTRESLFEPRIPDAAHFSPAFSTFGYRKRSGAQNGVTSNNKGAPQNKERHHLHYHYHHPHPPPRQFPQQGQQSNSSNSPPSRHPVSEQCSMCMNCISQEGSVVICPKHNPIPAPPGWSLHEDPCPHIQPSMPICPEETECMTYKRYQSPKPDRNPMIMTNYQQHQRHSPVFTRQNTPASGERYDSLIYGSGRASSNTTSHTTTASNTTGSGSQHSATPKPVKPDPRYRAEAIIEVDQKRPFSMESTKSAPDVIATH